MMRHGGKATLVASFVLFALLRVELAASLSVLTIVLLVGPGSFRRGLRVTRRDLRVVYRLIGTKVAIRAAVRDDATVAELFRATVSRHPNAIVFVGRGRRWTYLEAEDYTNRVANLFTSMGFRQGDTVGLVMENRPEYIFLWLGLSKIGVVTALINTNLRSKALAHSVSIVRSKAVLCSAMMAPHVVASRNELHDACPNLVYLMFEECPEAKDLGATVIDDAIASAAISPPSFRGRLDDRLMYIYTSGTTGLPKAAIIKQRRYIQTAHSVTHMIPVKKTDVIYLYLPFYHMAGACLGGSQPLINGTLGVVATKFSASHFWMECAENNVTVTQYIGEICRYLLMQPQRPEDRQHKVRLMYGNGLRKEIWKEFRDRFEIADICELYGSTEGTTSLLNIDNTVGAIGFFPALSKVLGNYIPMRIIKVDPVTGTPLRDSRGRCVTCRPGEAGEIVAIIRDDPLTKFDGYIDEAATMKKIYRDCFAKGDRVFSSGDLVYQDDLGYVYFNDRTGDTFRWRGENVSTTEVEAAVASVVADPSAGCAVFGVTVPGVEGRAGMASITDSQRRLDPSVLLKGFQAVLPQYAVPVFLRMTVQDDTTGTFKMSKINLQEAGFNPAKCHPDPVYFLDPTTQPPRYVPLDENVLDRINKGQARL
ncbi:long-chain fatty acid transport protein 4-like [Tropilaelaps mercedesae]|uniref:Very long-chain fatty acid transport protein n=1 Tax=Tropilaelaps mercedesae TaxID=418985 RepID=A0A1V9WZ21_9ACAR|nr:long-chain fatty acid transport protein 4-like [Tropilaelaps mercedesae]